jgi:hypothetical protein
MNDILQLGIDFFQKDEWPFKRLEDRPVLQTAFSGSNGQFNCWYQARQELQQICFYSSCPVRAPMESVPTLLEFVARANYGMVIGNFEIDVRDGEIRYKTSVDVEGIEPTETFMRGLVYANVLTMDRYLPGIMQVIYAKVSPEEAVKAVEQPRSES